MKDIPYEEYVPSSEELHVIEKSAPLVYATYWEVLCHFEICVETTGLRSRGVKQMAWANYLFSGLKIFFSGLRDKADRLSCLNPSTNAEIKERIDASTSIYTTKSNENTFRPGTVIESFHHQAKAPISNSALLAGFLILWLKRCVMPTLYHEVIMQMWCIRLSCWHSAEILPFSQQRWGCIKAGFGF